MTEQQTKTEKGYCGFCRKVVDNFQKHINTHLSIYARFIEDTGQWLRFEAWRKSIDKKVKKCSERFWEASKKLEKGL